MCTSAEKDTKQEDDDMQQWRRKENILQSSGPGVQLLWPAWAPHSSGSQLHTDRRRRGERLSEASDTITFGPGWFRAVWKQCKLLPLWPDNYSFQLFQSRVREILNTEGKRRWAEKKGKLGIKNTKGVEEKQSWKWSEVTNRGKMTCQDTKR